MINEIIKKIIPKILFMFCIGFILSVFINEIYDIDDYCCNGGGFVTVLIPFSPTNIEPSSYITWITKGFARRFESNIYILRDDLHHYRRIYNLVNALEDAENRGLPMLLHFTERDLDEFEYLTRYEVRKPPNTYPENNSVNRRFLREAGDHYKRYDNRRYWR